MWGFLNQSIVANSAAVILVAIFGFAFTNFYQCKTQSLTDNRKLDELFSEVFYRHTKLLGAINSNTIQADRFQQIMNALNPDITFYFLDNKDKAEYEIRENIDSVVYKWQIINQPNNSRPSDEKQIECDIDQIESNPDLSRQCDATFFDEFTNPLFPVNFANLLNQAKDVGADEVKRAKFLDNIDKSATFLLTNIQPTGLPSDLSRVISGMWNAAHQGRFFPSAMCRCRSLWP